MMTKQQKTTLDNLSLIGPHEGRELELMLSGIKPVAMFHEIVGHDEDLKLIPEELFQPYVDKGQIIKQEKIFKTIDLKFPSARYVFYALSNNSEKIDQIIQIKEDLGNNLIDNQKADREIGKLLGYSTEQIEAFIRHKY